MTGTMSFAKWASRTSVADLEFWARRLLRLNSTRPEWFAGQTLGAAEVARLAAIARAVRDEGGPRVAILHGVMPRSGTNYLNALLGLHPDVVIDPLDVKELPFLAAIPQARLWQEAFFDFYHGNREAMGDLDLLAFTVSGFLKYATALHPEAKLVVFKVPHTRYLSYFPALFPDDKCVVLLRDGQRTVQSTIATWPLKPFGKSFADICREWTYATDAALDYWGTASKTATALDRYEDIHADPKAHMADILAFLGLDAGRYPFDEIAALPVLGSSELSKKAEGKVSWEPVKASEGFNPAKRRIDWSDGQKATFERIAAKTMARAGYR